MRAVMGFGSHRINKYTIRKATQALVNTLKLKKLEKLEKGPQKVGISYDSRKSSFEFAREVASVCAANGLHAYITRNLNPVPLLSFAVRNLQADAGAMITASHNPPHYNGLKIYDRDGAQVTPPLDREIIAQYQALKDFSHTHIQSMAFEEGVERDLIHWIGEEVEEAYFEAIGKKGPHPQMCHERGNELSLIYTPLHGTGLIPCQRALRQMGFCRVAIVEEQASPDGNFPTVEEGPNPEIPSSLALAVEKMKEVNGDLAAATDPDADRIGLAINHHGQIHYPNGNQVGLLLIHYVLSQLKAVGGALPEKGYIIKSIVTSPLQEKVARHFGVEVENTLTGFKWIAKRLGEIERHSPERTFLFATEESLGYLHHDFVRDKDGVASLALIAEMALYYKIQEEKTLIDALNDIYDRFGFSHEALLSLNYEGQEGAHKIALIMEHFRKHSHDLSFAGERVAKLKDYRPGLGALPPSNVLGLTFSSGNRLYLRPSGTEPKIKFYIMVHLQKSRESQGKKGAIALTEGIIAFLKKEVEGLVG